MHDPYNDPGGILECMGHPSIVCCVCLRFYIKINNSWTELFNFQNSFNCH